MRRTMEKSVNCRRKDNECPFVTLLSSHKKLPYQNQTYKYEQQQPETTGAKRYRDFPSTAAGARPNPAGQARVPGKTLGHLAKLDLGAGQRRSARAGLRLGGAGLRARHEPGH